MADRCTDSPVTGAELVAELVAVSGQELCWGSCGGSMGTFMQYFGGVDGVDMCSGGYSQVQMVLRWLGLVADVDSCSDV